MLRYLLFPLLLCNSHLQGQSADFEWLDDVKCSKNSRTLSLLQAGADGFRLLRLETVEAVKKGDPAQLIPSLVFLNAEGKLKKKDNIPDLDKGELIFHFALPLKQKLVVAYSKMDEDHKGLGALYVRCLDVEQNKWAGEPQLLAEKSTEAVTASNNAWFSLSENEAFGAIFALRPNGILKLIIFDANGEIADLNPHVALPKQNGSMQIQQAFCSNDGQLLLQARILSEKNQPAQAGIFPMPYQYDKFGRAMPQAENVVSTFSNAFYLVKKGTVQAFYPSFGKYASLPALTSEANNMLLCTGFWGETAALVSGYFMYRIDLNADTAGLVLKSKFPQTFRKALLSEKEAAEKTPIPGLQSHRFCRSNDGKLWLLCEQVQQQKLPREWRDALAVRIDSSLKFSTVCAVERNNKIAENNETQFNAPVLLPAPKTGVWMLWNKGAWPSTALMLSPSKLKKGEDEHQELALSKDSGLTMLPHCLQRLGDQYFVVGESEYHEHFGIGRLGVAKKKEK